MRHGDILFAAIERSRDHLRPWMPWADQDRAATDAYLARAQASWDAGTDFGYTLVDPVTSAALGACGLIARVGPGALEIGYWLVPSATGRGVMTAAVRALVIVAFALPGVDRVEIHCDEANVRSAAVPGRLGFRLDRVVDDTPEAPGETGRSMVWVLEGPPPDAQ
ncbi:MAG: GNAT family N-acetyltransferase [Actinobacteria bacterium]|nr:GNAT family N-acetyltransferase [Actinomycetota bacterium]